jgi:hypothetical protein
MSDATPDMFTEDHADEAVTALSRIDLPARGEGPQGWSVLTAYAQAQATLALAQEVAALRLALVDAMSDAFGDPTYDKDGNSVGTGGAVNETLLRVRDAMP